MLKKYAINLGLTFAAISIILFLINAIAGGGFVFNIVIGIATLAFIVGLPVYFIRRHRAARGGFISFKDAFLTALIGLAIGGVINAVFTYIYAHVIDTSYVDTLVNMQIESSMKFMKGNMPEDEMVKTLTDMETKTRKGFTIPGMIINVGIMIGIYALLSLILAAILKKQPKNPFQTDEVLDN